MTDFISMMQLVAAFIAAIGALKGNTQIVYSFSWWAMILAMVVSIGYILEGDILWGCLWVIPVFLWKPIYKKAKKDLYDTD